MVYSQFVPGVPHLHFDPDGLILQETARPTLPYAPDEEGRVPLMQFMRSSALNDEVCPDHDSGLHNLRNIDHIEIHEAAATITDDIEHFSEGLVFLGLDKPAYLAVDLPGCYLKPADAVFINHWGIGWWVQRIEIVLLRLHRIIMDPTSARNTCDQIRDKLIAGGSAPCVFSGLETSSKHE